MMTENQEDPIRIDSPGSKDVDDITNVTWEFMKKSPSYNSWLKAYKEFKECYNKLLKLEGIYETNIDPRLVSPKLLNLSFSSPVNLLKTELCEQVGELVNQNHPGVIIQGPLGIGKSHALLAKVLDLRRKNYVVLYINNPHEWIRSKYTYLINELIYACMPLTDCFLPPDHLKEGEAEGLFVWFCLLSFVCENGTDQLKEKTLEHFKQVFHNVTEKQRTYAFLDQDDIYGEENPYYFRRQLCKKLVICYSANYRVIGLETFYTTQTFFSRMTLEEIKKLAKSYETVTKKFSEEDINLLYLLTHGNPFEAQQFLSKWKLYPAFKQNFKNWAPSFLLERIKIIQDHHEKEFMHNKNTKFKKDFDEILPFISAGICLEGTEILALARKVMNKDYMYIERETWFLKTLVPAAALAFQGLYKRKEPQGLFRIKPNNKEIQQLYPSLKR